MQSTEVNHGSSERFRYALVNRPASMGCIPSGLNIVVEPRPAMGHPHCDMARHGVLVTERELTRGELISFELAPLVDGAMVDVLADMVSGAMGGYAARYVELQEKEPGRFREKVLDVAHRQHCGVRYSIGDPDEVVDRVLVLLRSMSDAGVRK